MSTTPATANGGSFYIEQVGENLVISGTGINGRVPLVQLELYTGRTYIFTMSPLVQAANPIYITTTQDYSGTPPSDAFTTGVSNIYSGTIRTGFAWTVPNASPSLLYYRSSINADLGSAIVIHQSVAAQPTYSALDSELLVPPALTETVVIKASRRLRLERLNLQAAWLSPSAEKSLIVRLVAFNGSKARYLSGPVLIQSSSRVEVQLSDYPVVEVGESVEIYLIEPVSLAKLTYQLEVIDL